MCIRDRYHIDKTAFDVPFVCGAKDLGEALRRINEGASMIRTKGEPGTGEVVQAVRHMRMMQSETVSFTHLDVYKRQAVEQDATGKAKDLALAYALGIGGARAGVRCV